MRLLLATFTLTVLLAGCGDSDTPTHTDTPPAKNPANTTTEQPSTEPAPLESESQTLTRQDGDACPDQLCSTVELQWLTFPSHDALTQTLESTLIQQLSNGADEGAASLSAVADGFLADAKEGAEIDGMGWQLSAETKLLGERRGLATLKLNTYEITGGAHGMPATQLLNWDRRAQRRVTLQDILKPGKEEAFWAEAAQIHRGWLDNTVEADEEFRGTWPFQQTGDFHLTDDGLVLLYNVYSIAPYSMGQPDLTVPWDKLAGLVRERYQP